MALSYKINQPERAQFLEAQAASVRLMVIENSIAVIFREVARQAPDLLTQKVATEAVSRTIETVEPVSDPTPPQTPAEAPTEANPPAILSAREEVKRAYDAAA